MFVCHYFKFSNNSFNNAAGHNKKQPNAAYPCLIYFMATADWSILPSDGSTEWRSSNEVVKDKETQLR